MLNTLFLQELRRVGKTKAGLANYFIIYVSYKKLGKLVYPNIQVSMIFDLKKFEICLC